MGRKLASIVLASLGVVGIYLFEGRLAGPTGSSVALAQTPSLPSGPQNQPGQNTQPLGTLPTQPPTPSSTISSTASGASAPQGVTQPSSRGKSFGTVGAGLPGMTGGPPLATSPGAQDPSSRFMRPPVLPPLFCDPSINIPC